MHADSEDDSTTNVRYVEYNESGSRIAMISDPENASAWIESDVTLPLDP